MPKRQPPKAVLAKSGNGPAEAPLDPGHIDNGAHDWPYLFIVWLTTAACGVLSCAIWGQGVNVRGQSMGQENCQGIMGCSHFMITGASPLPDPHEMDI